MASRPRARTIASLASSREFPLNISVIPQYVGGNPVILAPVFCRALSPALRCSGRRAGPDRVQRRRQKPQLRAGERPQRERRQPLRPGQADRLGRRLVGRPPAPALKAHDTPGTSNTFNFANQTVGLSQIKSAQLSAQIAPTATLDSSGPLPASFTVPGITISATISDADADGSAAPGSVTLPTVQTSGPLTFTPGRTARPTRPRRERRPARPAEQDDVRRCPDPARDRHRRPANGGKDNVIAAPARRRSGPRRARRTRR